MIFNTPSFLLCFLLFLLLYACLREKWRLPALLALNLLWYSSWSVSWLFLLLGISAVNYWGSREKFLKAIGASTVYGLLIALNLTLLVVFRNFNPMLAFFSVAPSSFFGNLHAPFGINFYVFLTVSYLIDRWRGSRERESFVAFLTYVSFFPLVTAGPMERFSRLLPQFRTLGPLTRSNLADGIVIFAWGFFKKIAIADSLRQPARAIFFSPGVGLGTLLLGGLLSTFHVYADFSAYCDMGRGLARCLGIRLSMNFRPFYYAQSPTDFWRRWNITLGTWIRDYVTLPAMMRFGSWLNLYLILFASFFLMGLWHGFYWNWFLFGALNGLLVVVHTWAEQRWKMPRLTRALGFALAFLLFLGNGILSQAVTKKRLVELATNLTFANGWGNPLTISSILYFVLPLLVPLAIMDFWQEKQGELDVYLRLPVPAKWAFTLLCLGLGILFTRSEMNPFLYLNV